jgi:hypothetical protein
MSERYRLLARQVAWLEVRLAGLQATHQWFMRVRLLVFFGGTTAVFLSLFFTQTLYPLPLLILTLSLSLFTALVLRHRQVQTSMAQFAGWIALRQLHLARLRLAWEQIPPRPCPPPLTPLELDFDLVGERSLHHLLDTAVTLGGSQRLRTWLNPTSPDLAQIAQRQALIQELTPASNFRDRLTLEARLAAQQPGVWDTTPLQTWLTQPAPAQISGAWLALLTVTALSNLLLFGLYLFGLIGPWWYGSLLLYGGLWFAQSAALRQDIFSQAAALADGLRPLTAVFQRLEQHRYHQQPHLRQLCQPFLTPATRPSHYLRQVGRVVSGTGLRRNPFLWLLLNTAVPWDYFFLYQLQNIRQQLASQLPLWLDRWFELEALCSLATFAYLHPDYTLPHLHEADDEAAPHFAGRALGHPLIPASQRVCNDFVVAQQPYLALLTGSNMAGKSSFLRTVGLNLVLAYAGSVVCAERLETRPWRLFSAIKISDSLADGLSYFYAEVQRLKTLLDTLNQPDSLPLFFFIDEIFRGTNNRERLLGSQAYIEALMQGQGVGILATHDLELVQLAETFPAIHNFHFRETVADGQMLFDYTLHPGPCPTTNALRIMALAGLPVRL